MSFLDIASAVQQTLAEARVQQNLSPALMYSHVGLAHVPYQTSFAVLGRQKANWPSGSLRFLGAALLGAKNVNLDLDVNLLTLQSDAVPFVPLQDHDIAFQLAPVGTLKH